MKIAKELAKKAKQLGICQEWHTELKGLDNRNAMIWMYLKGIDFCLANDYPSNEYIRTNFKGTMENFGVFLDDSIDLSNVTKCVTLGNCKGKIEINNFSTSEIFVKHDSVLTIIAKDNAFVMVDVFDNTIVHIESYNLAKVCVNRYGMAKITQKSDDSATVKIVEKHKKTY